MDIIVGLSGEDAGYIENTCKQIFNLNPDSITVHGLSIKRASRLHESLINGKASVDLDQAEMNKMYEETVELAAKLNMKPYYMYRQKNMFGNMENIGYSKTCKDGIYNIQMIEERQTIIAAGADAVSKIVFLEENRIERFANVKDVKEYINRIDEMINNKLQLLNNLYN
jgi:oxygen-independent coproporphyrinogen-3 oxidase